MISAAEFLKWLNVFNVQQGSRTGTVTSVATGTGLTGGTITTSGTISFAAIAAGSFWANTTGGTAVPTVTSLASILAPYLPLAGGTMTGALNMGSHGISNLAAPVAATDACTKQYADNIAAGLNPVDAVVAASTANLTGWTYNNGTAGVGATLTAPSTGVFAPDGATLNVGDRFLYKNDTTGSGAYNGIYSVTVNNAGAACVLTRWTGYDTSTDIQKGDLTGVESGTLNANASYYLSSQPVIIGTDPLNYTSFFTPATYLQTANNLSDLNSASTARTNLGVPSTTGTGASGTWGISVSGNAATASAIAVGGITGLGTNVATALAINVGSAGAFVTNGGVLGTPSSGTLTNCTGYTVANLSDGAWTDISGSLSLTGFSGTPTITYARAKAIGKTYFFTIAVTGTSNADTFTITGMPKTANSAAGGSAGLTSNNGNNQFYQAWSIAASGTTITMSNNGTTTGWTTSGTKAAQFTGFYETT
jgi:hypothetical protein